MKRDGGHAALVLLVRAVDIEKAQVHGGGGEVCHAGSEHLVKQELRVAVAVQGPLVFEVFGKDGACAVGGGRTCVYKGDLELRGPGKKVKRIAVVVLHDVASVRFHRVGTGAHVNHGLWNRGRALAHAFNKVVFIEVVRDVSLCEV